MRAEYFDGRSARPRPVNLTLLDGWLHVVGDGLALRVLRHQVLWPERRRHGPRVAQLPDGATLHCPDGAAWDDWLGAAGHRESWVQRLQTSWRGVLVAAALLLAVLVAGYRWGVPAATDAVLAVLAPSVDQDLGDTVLASLQQRGALRPSTLPGERQAALRARFDDALARVCPAAAACPRQLLLFADSAWGPNALTLPGGTIVLTDAMATLLADRDDVLLGVLAHEYGHLRHRHGMRALVQTSLLGAVGALVLGDFSALLAGLPAALGQAAYSRDAEREADDEAIRVLRANGVSPAVMTLLFERLAARRPEGAEPAYGLALSGHPPDAERVARFQAAGAPR